MITGLVNNGKTECRGGYFCCFDRLVLNPSNSCENYTTLIPSSLCPKNEGAALTELIEGECREAKTEAKTFFFLS